MMLSYCPICSGSTNFEFLRDADQVRVLDDDRVVVTTYRLYCCHDCYVGTAEKVDKEEYRRWNE